MGMRIAWQSANGPRARGYGWKRMAGCGWMDRWMGRRWCMDGWALQVLRLDEIQMHSTAPAISTNELILPPARFFFFNYRASLFMPAHFGTEDAAFLSTYRYLFLTVWNLFRVLSRIAPKFPSNCSFDRRGIRAIGVKTVPLDAFSSGRLLRYLR